MAEPTVDQFWAVLTHKRDEGLAAITELIDHNGDDEFCGFLGKHVLPLCVEPDGDDMLVDHVIAHLALIGAVDALLAWRDKHEAD